MESRLAASLDTDQHSIRYDSSISHFTKLIDSILVLDIVTIDALQYSTLDHRSKHWFYFICSLYYWKMCLLSKTQCLNMFEWSFMMMYSVVQKGRGPWKLWKLGKRCNLNSSNVIKNFYWHLYLTDFIAVTYCVSKLNCHWCHCDTALNIKFKFMVLFVAEGLISCTKHIINNSFYFWARCFV